MNPTLSYLRFYIKSGWIASLPSACSGVLLVMLAPDLGMHAQNLWAMPVLLGILAAMPIVLVFKFFTPNDYLVSTGISPGRRFAALLGAYLFHSGLLWLAMAATVWLRLRSTIQDIQGNPFYPFVASVDDAKPLQWLVVIPLAITVFLEFTLRLSARTNLLNSITFTLAGIIAALIAVIASLFFQAGVGVAVFAAGSAILFTRLFNLFFLVRCPAPPASWGNPAPLPVRISDACLSFLSLGLCIAASLHQLINTHTLDQYHNLSSDQWPQLCLWYACVSALVLLVAGLLAANRNWQSWCVAALALAVLIFPCRWAVDRYIGPLLPDKNNDRLIFTASQSGLRLAVNGKDFGPFGYNPELNIGLNSITLSQLPPTTQPIEPYNPYNHIGQEFPLIAGPDARISQSFYLPDLKTLAQAQLLLDRQPILLSEDPPQRPERSGYQGAYVYLHPSSLETSRQYQPKVAWITFHSRAIDAHALITNNAAGLGPYKDYLPTDAQVLLTQLQLNDQYNAGSPIVLGSPDKPVSSQEWAIARAIVQQHRYAVSQAPAPEQSLLDQIIPRLSPEQFITLFARLYPQELTTDKYTVSWYTRPQRIMHTSLRQWLSSHGAQPQQIARLQALMTPQLIAQSDAEGMTILSGPQVAAFLEKLLVAPSQYISLPPGPPKSAQALDYPLLMGANLAGPEGEGFRTKHATSILALLQDMRSQRSSDLPQPALIPTRAPWFPKTMGPAPEPIRNAYWAWFIKDFAPRAKTPQERLELLLAELSLAMSEPRIQPYLQVIADPACRLPDKMPLTPGQRPDPVRSLIPALYSGLSLGRADATIAFRKNIFEQIIAHIRQDPQRFGLPPGPLSDAANKEIVPVLTPPQNQYMSSQRAQEIWLDQLLSHKTLTQDAKRDNLLFAIQTGVVSQPGPRIIASQTKDPWARPFAVDAAIRYPTPENLALLNTLATDPDPAVASRAQAGLKFIDTLKSTPLEKIPAPYTSGTFTFFDLGSFPK